VSPATNGPGKNDVVNRSPPVTSKNPAKSCGRVKVVTPASSLVWGCHIMLVLSLHDGSKTESHARTCRPGKAVYSRTSSPDPPSTFSACRIGWSESMARTLTLVVAPAWYVSGGSFRQSQGPASGVDPLEEPAPLPDPLLDPLPPELEPPTETSGPPSTGTPQTHGSNPVPSPRHT
jgi:hypothetical protein